MWYRTYLSIICTFSLNTLSWSQTEPPYKEIPGYPSKYTEGTVISRMIDGLGYRYYWATKNLREMDLDFTPDTHARSIYETMEHIYDLSIMILNASKNQVNQRIDTSQMNINELRLATLENLKLASQKVSLINNLKDFNMLFQNPLKRKMLPFWHVLNGPLADAIYHTGQIVSFRRTSGNPINPEVNVLMGKTDQ